MLANLDFSQWFVKGNEIFWKTDNKVREVVCQGIPASILVKLPGGLTNVSICFPIPSLTRIYVQNWMTGESYFIGQFGDGNNFYHLPKAVKYRYGVMISPWMYYGHLETDMKNIKSRIVNYVIENCCCGFDGILLKFRDELDEDKRCEEWFKIFWFSGGNEYHFLHEKHTEILHLLPLRTGKLNRQTIWGPKEGWEKFKRIRSMPVKI
ncbi:MAG: hypothetical protein ACOZAL_00430 [Patescibacteria group bacterium]